MLARTSSHARATLLRAATKSHTRSLASQSTPSSLFASSSTSGSTSHHHRRSLPTPFRHASRTFVTTPAARFATPVDNEQAFKLEDVERATDDVDVLIVGGGPAGLSAAIKVKQLAEAEGKEIRVVLLEKGSEVGAHILSGAVIEPKALDELIPDWKELGAPLNQPAVSDHMRFLTKTSSFPIPHPPQMSNKGNYIVSLSKVCRWLGEQAEALGVEIYPGFAGAQLLYSADGKSVRGVTTNEIGLDKEYQPKDSFEPGMAFRARVTLLAEGAHGSLSKRLIERFDLRKGKSPQTYGLGVKEVWKVKKEKHVPGKIVHTLGWPLDFKTYGGSWCYHMEDEMVSLGLVVGLDYKNPYISPFREFQRMKHHPVFAELLKGGECIAYGARTLNEGGLQSIPKLTVPGAALIGCTAGFLNVPKIKGTHNAMKSGMLAAETAFSALSESPSKEVEEEISETGATSVNENPNGAPLDMSAYEDAVRESWIWKELNEIRNVRPAFDTPLGLYGGVMYSGLDTLILKGKTPWTFKHNHEDSAATEDASKHKPIDYPSPDGKLSFDILTSVSRTGTNHAEDQPVHLVVKDGDKSRHTRENVTKYAGLLGRACPAAVYEYVDAADAGGQEDAEGKKFVINSQNCIHCYTCSVKVPTQDIRWCVPEGGGGPKYSIT